VIFTCSLRSASTARLVVPPFKLSTIGIRTFKVAAAQAWNGLPENVASLQTLSIFRQHICFENNKDRNCTTVEAYFNWFDYIVDFAK
jgi:hypothetical protein